MSGWMSRWFAGLLISERRLGLHRSAHEFVRRVNRAPCRLQFFHRVSDAWSWLLAQVLRELEGVEVDLRLVSALPVDSVADPTRLDRYAAYDAIRLGRAWSLDFPAGAEPPDPRNQRLAERIILARPRLQTALTATAAAWRRDNARLARMASEFGAVSEPAAAAALARNYRALVRQGHYLGGMIRFQGEWFWGLDRLGLLARRLAARGVAQPQTVLEGRFDPVPRGQAGSPISQTLEFYFSFRSPYSYLAAEPVVSLADRLGLRLELRPLLPMVARGVPVPRRKVRYILTDVARLSRQRGVPFGPLRDPLGAAVERCLAVFHAAAKRGVGREFMLAAMRAIWSEAADLARDPDLIDVAARVGLDAEFVGEAVASGNWRARVEANAAALAVLGLWGVPSYCLRGADEKPAAIAWGQDRLWALERAALGIDVATPVPGLVQ